MGQLYDESNRMIMNTIEFSYSDAACNTIALQPGKFIVGIDCCKLGSGSSGNLLNGASSQNSRINVLLNLMQSTVGARNLNLIVCMIQYQNLTRDKNVVVDPQCKLM